MSRIEVLAFAFSNELNLGCIHQHQCSHYICVAIKGIGGLFTPCLKEPTVKIISKARSNGLIPEPEELRNDPLLRANAEAHIAYLRSRGAPPPSYNAVEEGKT